MKKSVIFLVLALLIFFLGTTWSSPSLATSYDGATRFVYYYIEVPVELEDWESLDELKQFIKVDDSDHHVYLTANSDGEIKLYDFCVSQAEHLRDEAAKVGKNLEVQVLSPQEYRRIFGSKLTYFHAVCMARVDNLYFCIEVQNDILKEAYKIP